MAINKEQLEILYREQEKRLYNFTLRWVFDEKLAEEIVHEAFIRIWKKRDSIQLETLKSFLYKCTQNLCLSHLRRKKLMDSFDFSYVFGFKGLEFSDSEKSYSLNQELSLIKKALDEIPHKNRQVLLLAFYGEMSDKEISQIIDVPEGTVASRKSRALKKVQDHLPKGAFRYV